MIDPPPPLAVLGFTAAQERLYASILAAPDRPLDAVLAEGASPAGAAAPARADLDRLAVAGLVDLVEGIVVARPPSDVLPGLLRGKQERLDRAGGALTRLRRLVPTLTEEHLSARAPAAESYAVEVVPAEDVLAIARRLAPEQPEELRWLRPDPRTVGQDLRFDEWVTGLTEAGLTSRAIYSARVFEDTPDLLRRRAEAGEHVRIMAQVPSRLGIIGTRVGLLPERWGGRERCLIIRQEGLVSALVALFDTWWDEALAVPGLPAGDSAAAGRRDLLLRELARGARDDQIARTLGLSLRTVRRRIADIFDELGVESRFQAGVEAVRRGWL